MNKIKNSKLYSQLKNLKWKYINYFSEQGLFTRKFRHFVSQFDPLLQVKKRKTIYEHLKKCASPKILQIVDELKKKGYVFINLQDLGICDEEVLNFCSSAVENFNQRIIDPSYIDGLPQAKYAGKTIAYQLYAKSKDTDPMIQLACNETLLTICSLYIDYFPLIEDVSFVYNPIHGCEKFGSQLWHRDSQHKKILKLFFSPLEITKENGPFEFFPPSLSTTKYYRHLPECMTDQEIEANGLDLNCAIKFLAKPRQFLLVDTVRCLHRGGCTQKPRFISTLSFCSPLYSFSHSAYRKTGAYKFSFENFKRENEALMQKFSSLI